MAQMDSNRIQMDLAIGSRKLTSHKQEFLAKKVRLMDDGRFNLLID